MKKYYLFAIINLLLLTTKAQAPQMLNYQAVVRDHAGNILANQLVSVRLSIHNGSNTGTIVFQETDMDSTNQFGLFTVVIGAGTVTMGSFSTISWGTGEKFIQVEFDPSGGANFIDMGTTQLLSVPYAMYAGNGAGAIGATGVTGPTGAPGIEGIGIEGISSQNDSLIITLTDGSKDSNPWPPSGSGSQGPTGNTGAAGVTGPAGITGPSGPSGVMGPSGIGIDTIAVEDDSLVITLSNGIKHSNPWPTAILGVTGPTGITGPSGNATNAWNLTGNAGTSPSTNFIGASDNADLVFKAAGYPAGWLDDYNTAFGVNSLPYNLSASGNAAFGTNAMQNNSTGNSNVAVGDRALINNTSGSLNVALGESALSSNTGSFYNTGVGYYALNSVQGSYGNSGNFNTALGGQALIGLITGNNNTALGAYANGASSGPVTNYNNATVIGCYASAYNNNSIAIGYNADAYGTFSTAIGTNANVSEDSAMVLGFTGSFQPVVGLGTNMPDRNVLFDIESPATNGSVKFANQTPGGTGPLIDMEYGALKYNYGNPMPGYVLTSMDNNGTASWQALNANTLGISTLWMQNGNNIYNFNSGAVGIGTSTPDPTSLLDVEYTPTSGVHLVSFVKIGSTNGGTLLDVEQGPIKYVYGSPQPGYVLTTTDGSGTASWQPGGWGLQGNSGTVPATDFIGTTDDNDIIFKRKNIVSGLLNSSSGNTSWGVAALNPNNTGIQNTAVGSQALESNISGSNNTANGYAALETTNTGSNSTAIGYQALLINANTSGGNTAVGSNAMDNDFEGSNNTAIGYNAQTQSSPALTNATAIGANAIVAQNNAIVLGAINGVNGASANTDVGIGTTSPTAALDVRGNIVLGSTGQYFAAGGTENLLLIRGTVDINGDIVVGSNFTATHVSTGVYQITFNTCFSETPTVTANAGTPINYVTTVSSCGFYIYNYSIEYGPAAGLLYIATDAGFQFIAVGPR